MSNDCILATEGVSKQFGGLTVVDGVSIKVRAGTVRSVIGPNGAGKTTFFNLISGWYKPSSGQVYFKGEDITGLPPHQISHRGLGRSFQITSIFPDLTVLENVRLAVQSRGKANFRLFAHFSRFKDCIETAGRIVAQVRLAGKENVVARTLSHGDKRKLEIGILLGTDPEVLLLDEPTAGMSHEEVPAIIEVIGDIKATGKKTILLVEHKVDMVMNISDAITVLRNGAVIAEGTPREIAANELVQSAYLGGLA